MLQVKVTELRNRLPYYIKQVQNGAELQVTSHGKKIARLIPETDIKDEAYNRLMHLRGTVIKGDILEPIQGDWNADADNL